jgi:alkanesulfonate monooxygenase SsuD/methylene tetrahydromethanopterin reductase-like flavin-dependent oxidoreductase (luciferase family)
LPIAAAIAARTKRIRTASGVLLMPFHNPVRLAEDIAVVDVISGGRFELGVGTGYKLEEFRSRITIPGRCRPDCRRDGPRHISSCSRPKVIPAFR